MNPLAHPDHYVKLIVNHGNPVIGETVEDCFAQIDVPSGEWTYDLSEICPLNKTDQLTGSVRAWMGATPYKYDLSNLIHSWNNIPQGRMSCPHTKRYRRGE